MTTLPNVDRIRKALSTAERLRKSIVDYQKEITNSNCDKHNAGFNLRDDRFCSAKVTLKIISWLGHYGNSGCSTAIDIFDQEVFQKAFVKVLNRQFFLLLEQTADVIEKDARIEKEKALAELDGLRELIEGKSDNQ